MQIRNLNTTPQQSFGMAVKVDREAANLVANSFQKMRDWIEFDQIIRRQANNKVADIFVSRNDDKFVVQVGAESVRTRNPKILLKAIKNAEKYADDLRLRTEELELEKSDTPYQDVVDKIEIDLEPVKDVLYKGVIKSQDAIKRFNKIANMANINGIPKVNLFTNLSKRVSAVVGSKEFKQGMFNSTLTPIEDAVKYADNLRVKENALDIETNPNYVDDIMAKVVE
ncbi:MAG: hypothetical protein E7Z87_04970 [Cyanobacteria bacterium SIG26]|nr:hypothetical protein [Cyanobacteria bacterium SIG26]